MNESDGDTGKRGVALAQAGRYELALPLLRSGLAADPESTDLLNHLAMCLQRTGADRESLPLAERSIATAPQAEWGHRLKAIAHIRLGDHKQALNSALEARRLAPNEERAHLTVAHAYFELHRLTESSEATRAALRLVPDFVPALNHFGAIALERGNSDEAREWATKALAVDPQSATARNLLGVVEQRRGKEDNARTHWVAAARSDHSAAVARDNFGNSVIHGGIRQALLWRFVVCPAVAGATVGRFGWFGVVLSGALLVSVKAIVVEIRLRGVDAAQRAYLRQRWRARVQPAWLGASITWDPDVHSGARLGGTQRRSHRIGRPPLGRCDRVRNRVRSGPLVQLTCPNVVTPW